MTPDEMRVLYDYNAWANHRELDAASALTPEQFLKPMGSSFSSIRAYLRRRMDLARALSRPLAVFPSGYCTVQRRRRPARALG